jgi:intracellular septation protein A
MLVKLFIIRARGWLPQTSEQWWLSAFIGGIGLLVVLIGWQLVNYLKKKEFIIMKKTLLGLLFSAALIATSGLTASAAIRHKRLMGQLVSLGATSLLIMVIRT